MTEIVYRTPDGNIVRTCTRVLFEVNGVLFDDHTEAMDVLSEITEADHEQG